MTKDGITRLLLMAIALGLWLNALGPWLGPLRAASDADSVLREIRSAVQSIEYDLGRIERGTCTNGALC